MIFLPVVERELRVAARKRSTVWFRIVAAVVALLIGAGFLLVTRIGAMGAAPISVGRGLFLTLTWLCLIVALSSGLFLTSDCLSEEKREGTLGFLFLTELHGYDVVLGKLMATSLRGAYGLLALFPVLAVTLTMGGVTGGQFWQTMLALLNALFVSLAAGLFVSSLCRDSQRALGGTLLLLLLLVVGGPAFDATWSAMDGRSFVPMLSLASPGYLFAQGLSWGGSFQWSPLLVNQAIGWVLLGVACWWVPRTWTEGRAETGDRQYGLRDWWRFGGRSGRLKLRQKLVEVNAVLWLLCRERWQGATLWFVMLLMVTGFVAAGVSGHTGAWMIWSGAAGLLKLVVFLGIASQAGRFFVEGRRNGLLELLLATPLRSDQIVQGQWRALVRMFGAPLGLFLVAQLLGSILVHQATWSLATAVPPAPPAAARPTTSPGTNTVASTQTATSPRATVTYRGGVGFGGLGVAVAQAVAGTVATIISLVAMIWFGMWMGLTSRSVNLATLKTVLFTQVIPWLVISFASALMMPLLVLPGVMGGSARYAHWYPLIMSGVFVSLSVLKDVVFLFWARGRLRSGFRERAAPLYAAVRPSPPKVKSAVAPSA